MIKSVLAGGITAVAIIAGANAGLAQERITYLLHSTPTNVFWQAVKLGMDKACEQIQADCQMVFLQQDGNFQEQLNNLEAAIANNPTGIINTFAGGSVFDEALQRAVDAGIPVIASNVDHPEGKYRLAYVGQNLEQAGYDLAKAQSANFPAEGPIHILIGVNGPGQVWSETRAAGIERFVKEYIAANTAREITYERIDAGLDLSIVGQRVGAYVQATPTTAYFDTGYWHAGAAVALRDLGKKPGEVLLAGFDLVPVVFDEMKSGYIQLTVDQQPYLQGYYPVHQLYLLNNFKFPPFDVDTGKALVTPADVDALLELSAQGIR
ncbi:MAG TPA: substrate-binding domain-containing protein [Bauldia sp.]|nr:substrate-binding domain-containing protein [Bauldia sp.]